MSTFIAIYGSFMFLAAAVAGVIAYLKRRDTSFWMTICFMFPPALLLLAVMPKNVGPRARREGFDAQEDRELKRDDGDRVF